MINFTFFVVGNEKWPCYLKLKFVNGFNFDHCEHVALPSIDPNETTDVIVAMTSPLEEGLYQAQWRVVTLSGMYCGSK